MSDWADPLETWDDLQARLAAAEAENKRLEGLKADVKRLQKSYYNEMVDHEETKARLAVAEAENKRLREALEGCHESNTTDN